MSLTRGGAQTFTAACSDSGGNLRRVDWYSNGTFDHSSAIRNSNDPLDYYQEVSWTRTFSAAGSFNIGAVCLDYSGNYSSSSSEVAWIVAALLPAPSLSNPSNGTGGVSQTPTFSWSAVSGANRYWLLVATTLSALPTDPNASSCGGCVIAGTTEVTNHTLPNSFPNIGKTGTLSASTVYYWKVQPFTISGSALTAQGNYSPVFSFTTQAPASLPTAPSSLIAAGDSSNILLQWADNSTNESGFKIERKAGTAGTFSQIGTASGGVASYQAPPPTVGDTYCFRVRAYNGVGDSAYSNTTCAKTLAIPSLTSPTNGSTIAPGSISLQWSSVWGANSYGVDVGNSCGGTSIANNAATPTTAYTPPVNLVAGTYYWRVRAASTNDLGVSDASTCRSFIVPSSTPPNPPSGLLAVGDSSNILIQWTDASSNEAGFKVERKAGTAGAFAQIAQTGAGVNNFTGPAPTIGDTYCFRVRSYNGNGDSTYSNTACGKALAAPQLTAPSNGATLPPGTIVLQWVGVWGANAYGIDMGTACGGSAIANNAASATTSYSPPVSLSPGTYFWRVRASNTTDLGISNVSPCRSITISASSPPSSPASLVAIGDSSMIHLQWNDTSSNESGFKIERKSGTSGTYSQVAIVAPGVSTYQTPPPTMGDSYCFRIKSYNSNGDSSPTNEACAKALSSPSLTLPADDAVLAPGAVTLSWNGVWGAEVYGVDIGNSCGGTSIANNTAATSTSYTPPLTFNTGTYFWRVRASNTTHLGVSDPSACRSFDIGSPLSSQVDLLISASGGTFLPGQTGALVPVTVYRGGTNLSKAVNGRLYWSSDSTLSATDTLLWQGVFSDTTLNAYGQNTLNASFTAPSVLPGTYYLIARVDEEGAITESDEGNNISSPYPVSVLGTGSGCNPLDVSDYSSGARSLTGVSTVSDQCLNSSADVDWFEMSLDAGALVKIDLMPPTGKDYDMALFGPDTSNTAAHLLTAATAGTAGVRESISYSAQQSGHYYVRVYGYQGAFDNQKPFSITWTSPSSMPLPDLWMEASINESCQSGSVNIPVSLTMRRSNALLPTGSYVHAKLYWSTDRVWDPSDLVLWRSKDGLAADFLAAPLNSIGSVSTSAFINIPNMPAGNYFLLAFADAPQDAYPSGYLKEADELNNVIAYPIQLTTAPPCADEAGDDLAHASDALKPQVATSAKICNSGDRDWFRVRTDGAGEIAVKLGVPAGRDFDLSLHDSTGRVVAKSDKPAGNQELLSFSAGTGSTFYIQVYGWGLERDSENPYSLVADWPTSTNAKTPSIAEILLRFAREDQFVPWRNFVTHTDVPQNSNAIWARLQTSRAQLNVAFRVTPEGGVQPARAVDYNLGPGTAGEIMVSSGLVPGRYNVDYRLTSSPGTLYGAFDTGWVSWCEDRPYCLTLANLEPPTPPLCASNRISWSQTGRSYLCAAAGSSESDPERTPLIFIHGICGFWEDGCSVRSWDGCKLGGGAEKNDYQCIWSTLLNNLMQKGIPQKYQPYFFRYETSISRTDGREDTIDKVAATLSSLIRARFHARRIAFIAHSMGGIVVRTMMEHQLCEQPGGGDALCGENVLELITLSTPHHGSGVIIDLANGTGGTYRNFTRDLENDDFVTTGVPGDTNWFLRCLNSQGFNSSSSLDASCPDSQRSLPGYYSKVYALASYKDEAMRVESATFQDSKNRHWNLPYRERFDGCWGHSSLYTTPETCHGQRFGLTPLEIITRILGSSNGLLLVGNPNLNEGLGGGTPSILWQWSQVGQANSYKLFDRFGNQLASLPSTASSWLETGLPPGEQLRELRAYDGSGNKIASSGLVKGEASIESPLARLISPAEAAQAGVDPTSCRAGTIQEVSLPSYASNGVGYGNNAAGHQVELALDPISAIKSLTGLYKVYVCARALQDRAAHTQALAFRPMGTASNTVAPTEVGGLTPGTTYQFSYITVGQTGAVSPSSSTVSIYIPPVPAEISVSSLSGSGRFTAADGMTSVYLESAPVSATTLYQSTNPQNVPIMANREEVTAANRRLPVQFTGSGDPTREFVLFDGASAYEGGLSGSITLPYQDADNDGIVDGTSPPLSEDELTPYTLSGGKWAAVTGPIARAPKDNTVTFPIEHLSVYTLNAPTPAAIRVALDGVRTFPVPWTPGSGDRFDSGNVAGCGSGIIFDNLTDSGSIRIYNIVGDLIRSLSYSNGDNGCKSWDGKNDSGATVASGVYFALIKAATGQTVKELAIER